MRVTVTLVEPALGASLTEGGQPAAFAGLGVVPFTETVGLVRFSASSKRAGSTRDTKGLQVCQIRGIALERFTALVPLPVVAGT